MEKTLRFFSRVDCTVDGNDLSFQSNEVEIKVIEEYVISQDSIKIGADCFEGKGDFEFARTQPYYAKCCIKACEVCDIAKYLESIILLLIVHYLK